MASCGPIVSRFDHFIRPSLCRFSKPRQLFLDVGRHSIRFADFGLPALVNYSEIAPGSAFRLRRSNFGASVQQAAERGDSFGRISPPPLPPFPEGISEHGNLMCDIGQSGSRCPSQVQERYTLYLESDGGALLHLNDTLHINHSAMSGQARTVPNVVCVCVCGWRDGWVGVSGLELCLMHFILPFVRLLQSVSFRPRAVPAPVVVDSLWASAALVWRRLRAWWAASARLEALAQPEGSCQATRCRASLGAQRRCASSAGRPRGMWDRHAVSAPRGREQSRASLLAVAMGRVRMAVGACGGRRAAPTRGAAPVMSGRPAGRARAQASQAFRP